MRVSAACTAARAADVPFGTARGSKSNLGPRSAPSCLPVIDSYTART
ncbi:Uncharacterised protein [Mycobacteroides abscessus subsp. abscessus]|nr:Uncharacterised protein [Mycobacteroides abscessus subsp. abscessus]